MKDTLISLETAKLAKKLGFNIDTDFVYSKKNLSKKEQDYIIIENICLSFDIPAPTQSLLQKWLREKHNLSVEPFTIMVIAGETEGYRFSYHIFSLKTVKEVAYDETPLGFLTWEEALETGLQEALKLIKN